MIKALFLLTALALVQARPNEDGTAAPTAGLNPDDCETLDNGCPVDFTIHKLLPHEEYCHLFYNCVRGEKVLSACSEPLFFSPEYQVCVQFWQTSCVNDRPFTYPTTVAPEIESTTAPGDADIGDVLDNGCPANFHIHHLLRHEECEKYYRCNFGERIVENCAPGTVFNFQIQVCDWPFNVPECAGSAGATAAPRPDSSEEIPLPGDQISWDALPNGCPADWSIHHLLPHESNCGLYYSCVHGAKILMPCGAATHFSPTLQTCTWPHEAGCQPWTGGCTTPGDGSSGCGSTTEEPLTTTIGDSTQGPTDAITDSTTSGPTVTVPSVTTPVDSSEEILLPDDAVTQPQTQAPEITTTTAAPVNPTTTTAVPETTPTQAPGTTTTAVPVNPTTTTAVPEITPTQVPDTTTTAVPVNPTTTTAVPDTTTTAVPVNPTTTTAVPETTPTQVPDTTTTAAPPVCPICPPGPVNPADRCKEECNVAPWAHAECDKYYICIGDQFFLRACSEGLHFNPTTLTCDFICNAGCVRNIPQVTRHSDGMLMFIPNDFNNKHDMMHLIEHELEGEL